MAKKTAKKQKKKRKKKQPSANGQSDRDNSGKFVGGNKASVGNKKGTDRKSKELKKALLDAVTEKDIKEIAKAILKKAKKGDTPSIKELFDRLWGRPKQGIEIGGVLTLCDIAAQMAGNDNN